VKPAARAAQALAAATAVAALAAAAPARALPSPTELRAAYRVSDLTLLDRRGEPVQTLRMDTQVRRLAWVPLEDMSPALLNAIVLSEDRRFWQHSGVDWGAAARSAWANLFNTRTRGASTVTMQLAGLIDAGLARPTGGRSVTQKLGQVLTASQLEARWKKSEILEAYLNNVPWRGEIVGINALSQTLFGKHPHGLDEQEAAIAAALVRAPNAGTEAVAERACGVLKLARRVTAAEQPCAGLAVRAQAALARQGGPVLGEQIAPHFARQVLRADGPEQQRSTLDAGLQRVARNALRQQLAELQGRNVEDGAVLVLDNASGEVLAWVGSSGSYSDAPQVDAVLARRQPGSTLKPFVYELAFERRLVTPASLLDDSPAQINTTAGLYLPQNYDRHFKGWVSVRTALGGSLNVPAVRVGAMLGPDALFERFNALGLALPRHAGWYGHALALGGAEVTLLHLANAYRTLANGGLHSAPVLRAGEARPAPRRVVEASAAYLVTDILADNTARVLTFGLNSHLATRGFAAVKTGTSKDMRDNWCVGFTDRYTVAVWVGNASGEPMHEVSGVSGAAPVWRTVVNHLHQGRPSQAPPPPAGVLRAELHFAAHQGVQEPPRSEVFLAGTEPQARAADGVAAAPLLQAVSTQVGQPGQRAQAFGISSPRDGSLFALDPDIPPAHQRITFEGQAGTWLLDGQVLGRGSRLTWAPWPGRHELVLQDGSGRVLQAVKFEVRGAGVRATKPPAAGGRART
jgi:penicillin-binding protein 1C